MVNSKFSGRQLTCGYTGMPWSSSLIDSSSSIAETPGTAGAGQQRGPRDRATGRLGDLGELVEGEAAAHRGLDHALPGIAEGAGDRGDLGDVGGPARHRPTLVADVGRRLRRGEPERRRPRWPRPRWPASVATSSAVASRSVLSVPMTHRRTGVCPIIDATLMAGPRASTASRYSGKVSNGHSSPSPARSAAGAHALDLLEGADDEVAVRGQGRGHAEAAVADDHGGDAVPRRHGEHAVPQDLGVVVGVDVDEAGGDDAAGGVDRGAASAAASASPCSMATTAPSLDGHVGGDARGVRCRR